ncbi:sigma 54-interacting transcriptional regulator [Aquabacterium sp.]|uniref:sigma-54 dependent transcriptional regulator n=1 Tax=Aquabacterium sp. TaxID=1872578 RepID=UPI0025C2ED67|nr:sigma 54-interacting transcriptional regulator [Aquabacterium sp.]
MNQLTCSVTAGEPHGALGRELHDCIVAGATDLFTVELHACLSESAPCDLSLPLVDADNVAEVAATIAAWRLKHPRRLVIPVVMGLTQPQLLALLSAGAIDFVSMPLDEVALLTRLRRAVGAMPVTSPLQMSQVQSPALRELVGSSPAFVKQLAMLPTIAGCDAGVLILGETGTGKEVCARAIHYTSARATRPMVAVNCGAIPSDLLESELFGHVRGAFTSAHATRSGLVREAEGGTLFLDEIDSLPLPAQAKLLRFLQDMEFRPVGGDSVLKANVRVIAACNQDLAGLVERGLFRRDLFFRLHVLTVLLPPLRDRAEDICTLALRFLQQFSAQSGRPPIGLSPQAVKRLLAHDWPGNVRELKHVIERAVLLAQGSSIQPDDLQLQAIDANSGGEESFHDAKTRIVDAFERGYLERLLAAHGGNITQAAEVAQKNRRALFELIRKHGICAERFRPKDAAAH